MRIKVFSSFFAFLVSNSLMISTPFGVMRMHPFECSGIVPQCIRMPDLLLTPSTSGIIFLNRGDHVIFSSYLPSGMIYSAFSKVGNTCAVPVIVPRTALPMRLSLFRWMVAMLTLPFVSVVNSEQRSRECRNLAEAY